MEKRLIEQVKFIVEVDKAKEIMRRTYLTKSERFENDAEHSWHLALMAPLLKEHIKEDVNIEKVINMVIIHDLVEMLFKIGCILSRHAAYLLSIVFISSNSFHKS